MKKNDHNAIRLKSLMSKSGVPVQPTENKPRAIKKEETAPIPRGIDQISLQVNSSEIRPLHRAKVIQQKIAKPSPEQMHCTQNQNYPLFFIEKAENLRRKKVSNIKFKERFIAARNFKRLSQMMQHWMHHEVRVLDNTADEFYNLLQKREERHFQLDRIIRYLSDT